jgi:hypothetical protein
LPDGSHTATISAKDKDGNPASLSWKFTIDTKPPVISNYVPQNNRSVMAGRKVIRATISDSLSGIDESSIVVKINGKKVTHQYHSSTGHVTAITDRLEGVTCSVYISVKDKAGNTAHANWKFTTKKEKESEVDSISPSISALTPENKSTVNVTQVEIRATVKDSESGISAKSIVLKVDGKKVQHRFDAAFGKVSFTSQNLKPGRHKLYIYVEDNFGNKASKIWTFTKKP